MTWGLKMSFHLVFQFVLSMFRMLKLMLIYWSLVETMKMLQSKSHPWLCRSLQLLIKFIARPFLRLEKWGIQLNLPSGNLDLRIVNMDLPSGKVNNMEIFHIVLEAVGYE